ncbi:hypothetical protein [Campylobacter curvus]|uniref:hypothetical protein n=1 Tax=Campylobacter curvus TaxID=200 RepID=UPI0014704ED0|nr:hypothetical protein [Campylobacter curvus]
MRKFIFFALIATGMFGFDIDDFDKGINELNNGNLQKAYDIFSAGCEAKDELSCEELGLMYINGEVSEQMDASLQKRSNIDIGVEFVMKSCDLGYLNACSDIVDLKKDIGDKLAPGVYENALTRYDELTAEYKDSGDQNATQAPAKNE